MVINGYVERSNLSKNRYSTTRSEQRPQRSARHATQKGGCEHHVRHFFFFSAAGVFFLRVCDFNALCNAFACQVAQVVLFLTE